MDWKKYSYARYEVSVVLRATDRVKEKQVKGGQEPPRPSFVSGFLVLNEENHSEILRTIAFNPIFEASVLTVAKRKSDIPIRAEDPTIA